MPTVFNYKGIKFHFFANEGNPREPLHIHAERRDAEARFWLRPDVSLAKSLGFIAHGLTELRRIIEGRRTQIEGAWHEFFREGY